MMAVIFVTSYMHVINIKTALAVTKSITYLYTSHFSHFNFDQTSFKLYNYIIQLKQFVKVIHRAVNERKSLKQHHYLKEKFDDLQNLAIFFT